jgi:hypothetical protein
MLRNCKFLHPIALGIALVLGVAIHVLVAQSTSQTTTSDSPNHGLTLSGLQARVATMRAAVSAKVATAVHKLAESADASTFPTLAPFLGNLTAITGPSGAVFMVRQADCSLELFQASYTTTATGNFGVSVQETIPDYQMVLHNNALLNTKPNQSSSCPDDTLGVSSRFGAFERLPSPHSFLGVVALGDHSTSNDSDSIAVAVFDANGNTSAYSTYDADSTPQTVAGGDLNGDGIEDFVSANLTSITVFLGNANGTLQAGVNYDLPSGTSAGTIAIDDVMGDGNLDVIVSEGNAQFAVYPGNGHGTLGVPQVTAAAGPTSYLVTGDFNGDGSKDIATGSGQIFLNNGSGTFTAVATPAFTIPTNPTLPEKIAVGDVNKDGKLDLVVENASTGAIQIFTGKGDGTFTAGNSYVPPNGAAGLYVTDLDGDGNPDIYVGTANGGVFGGVYPGPNIACALMGNGDGTFQGAPFEPFYAIGNQQYDSATFQYSASTANILDLNGDKKLDALAITQSTAGTSVGFTSYLGDGNGTFFVGPFLSVTAPFTDTKGYGNNQLTLNGITSYASADFNGDGIPDLAYTGTFSFNGNQVPFGYFIALGKGDGSFNVPTLSPNDASYISSISTADFNHDGKADIAYYAGNIPSTTIQLGNGDGTFQSPILVPLSGGTSSVQGQTVPPAFPVLIQDVNGDGFPDLLVLQLTGQTQTVAGYGSPQNVTQFALYLGKGDGTFQPPVTVTGADLPQGLATFGDLNGDGKPDLISTGLNTNGDQELATSIGNGDGTFQKPTIYLLAYSNVGPGNLTAADFNGDGKQDLTFSNGVFLGNGDGTLQVTANSDGTSAPTQQLELVTGYEGNFSYGGNSFAGDFNGDGRLDLLNGTTLLLNEYGVAIAGSSSSTTALSASPNPATVGQSVTFTATVAAGSGVSGTPTGTVTFSSGSTNLGTGTLSGGTATFSTSSLAAGTYSITAVYGGDSNFAGSSSAAVSLTVSAAPTTIATTTTLTASATNSAAGSNLIFAAAVTPASGSGVPTGSVTFSDGTTQLGTGTLDSTGKATYSTSSLAVGTHSITAAYGGDTNYMKSASAPVSVTITAATSDFSLSLSQASGTVSQSSSITSAVTITSSNGFNQPVSLSCSGAPSNATCSLSPTSVTPSGTSPGTATMTIQTGVKAAALALPNYFGHSPGSTAWAFLSGGRFLSFALLRRRRRSLWTRFVTLLALSCGLIGTATGCGSSGHSTPSGTYTITVTATSGTDSHSANYSLTVQ